MQPLSPAQLLELWERGRAAPPAARAVLLLDAACPESTPEALARLSIGRRDNLLLTLRELTFGTQLTGVADCPACGQRIEASFRSADIRATPPEVDETFVVVDGEYEVRFRLPDSRDLLAVPASSDSDAARCLLLERCVVGARRRGEPVVAAELPDAVVAAVTSSMAESDPQADVRFELQCPECGQAWQSIFDVVGFFWTEIDAWAQRILGEVHSLARAYGWREAEILNLSPQRRQIYLDLLSR
jgi:uncharacterized protein (UPF0212 family)